MEKETKKINLKTFNQKFMLAQELEKIADCAYANGSPWTSKQFLDTLNTKNVSLYGSYVDKKIVGFLIATHTSIELDVYMIAVKKEYQNKQLGSDLFIELEKELKNKKVETIFLEVRESNNPAIHLYKKMGFIEIALRKNYYNYPKESAIIMKKDMIKSINNL